MSWDLLQFQPWRSGIDISFWYEFCKKKLDIFKLSEEPVNIRGRYVSGFHNEMPIVLEIQAEGFTETTSVPVSYFPIKGTLLNFNTLESFKRANKKKILHDYSTSVVEAITTEKGLKDPSSLNKFLLIAFGNLKKYHFYYYFVTPAFFMEINHTAISTIELSSFFDDEQNSHLYDAISGYLHDKISPLQEYKTASKCVSEREKGELVFLAIDSSSSGTTPAWPLRNMLTIIPRKVSSVYVNVPSTSCRENVDVLKESTIKYSYVLTIGLGKVSENLPYNLVGWETTPRGRLLPTFINLSKTMDPKSLANSAVDLNLKLMRWRVLPGLDLEKVASAKCLLLGAGTLGCNIARSLLGWGVRNITFVDNGKVSYSNPVRQTLFTFEDSKNARLKATCAAEMLEKIFPGVNAKGVVMTIPMPGHPVESKNEKETLETVKQLEDLIATHDVIFLGLDSREARWLPTLLCAVQEKITINVALGFDTWVVMRHGINSSGTSHMSSTDSPTLGCYFCNDVMAPRDSLTDRTLDQQCTVTRPGLSFVASSSAVELMVSLLHHPLGGRAPAETRDDDSLTPRGNSPLEKLGLLPHQLRGFIANFNIIPMRGEQYKLCVACSPTIVETYKNRGGEFLLSVFNQPKVLEDVSGITEMKEQQENIDMEWESDDEEFSMD